MTLIGFTDSVTECTCCGKSDLKGTFEFEGGAFYGSECAKKVTKVSDSLLKVAKMKSEYNLVAFNQDTEVIAIQNKINGKCSIPERKNLIKILKEKKEAYKI